MFGSSSRLSFHFYLDMRVVNLACLQNHMVDTMDQVRLTVKNALDFLLTWRLHTEFSYYFETQNNLIRTGHLRGKCIDLIALGINNG